MKKKSFIISSVIVLLGGVIFVHFYAPRSITEIRNPLIQIFRKKHSGHQDGLSPHITSFSFSSKDGTLIKGHISPSKTDSTRGTIILLHGIRGYKEHFLELSSQLADSGYQSVAIDLRAHGESGGKHCTFGYFEKEDISSLLDFLEREKGISDNLGLWGQSLGGAIALQALAADERLSFGVIESTFSDLSDIVNDYSKYHLGFAFRPLSDYLLDRAGTIAGFEPLEVSPARAAKEIRKPVLMAHGTSDNLINISYGRQIFDNLASRKKTFLEIEGAGHINVWKKGGPEYFDNVFRFINNVVDSH